MILRRPILFLAIPLFALTLLLTMLSFSQTAAAHVLPTQEEPAPALLINEVDADTEGRDTLEFVELYDGGVGNTALDNYILVLFNGSNDRAYANFDLSGFSTDANGYFVVGNSLVASVALTFTNSRMQNGTDAVALYAGNPASYTNDLTVTAQDLVDAVVYHTNDEPDPELQTLLNSGQTYVNEGGGEDEETESIQRCPEGSGGAHNTDTYILAAPTPGGPCPFDRVAPDAPVTTSPASSLVNDGAPLLSGTAEAGATLTATVDAQNYAVVVGADGSWQIQLPNLPDGSYTPTFTLRDEAGNRSDPVAGTTFTIDTVAPLTPTLSMPAARTTLTNTTPMLGGSAEPSTTLTVTVGTQTLTTTVNADGSWVVQPEALADGIYTPTLTVRDAAGNATGPVEADGFTIDTSDPSGPTDPDEPGESNRELYLPIITRPTAGG